MKFVITISTGALNNQKKTITVKDDAPNTHEEEGLIITDTFGTHILLGKEYIKPLRDTLSFILESRRKEKE